MSAGSSGVDVPSGSPPVVSPAAAAAGGSASAPATSAGSGSSTGSASTARPSAARRARTTRTYRDNRPFLERHRMAVLGVGVLAIVLVVSGFVFFQATQPLYACSSIFNDPAATSPSGAPQPDRGKTHLTPGTFQAYSLCPPASGPHNNTSQYGPITPRYYGPDEQTVPQGWVHNLEHGALVVLYKCDGDVCGDQVQQQLRQFVQTFPNSPVCGVKAGVISPVVTRFEQMPHAFAALVWDRVMYLDSWDPARILAFFNQYGERSNPEQLYCTPPPSVPASASPAASGSTAPSAPASTEPSAAASASPS
jgi:hypothetical protein